jgi:hypothetical protein
VFFNAHAYYSLQRSRGMAPSLRIMGALIPDSAFTGTVNWTDLHDARTIQNFISQLAPQLAALGDGLMDHYELDRSSHNAFQDGAGYAYTHQTPQLRDLVAQACQIDNADTIRRIAHNFIESGVDINLLQQHPEIQGQLRQAVRSLDLNAIAKSLAGFFGSEPAETHRRLLAFTDVMTQHDLRTTEGWTALWANIVPLLLKTTVDGKATAHALQLAVALTAQDYHTVIEV